jgi:hypothetical protein
MSKPSRSLPQSGQFARTAACALVLSALSLSVAAAATTVAPRKPAHTTAARAPDSRRQVTSPYARAAAGHVHVGERPVGNAPTLVQGMGKPHRPHAGAASK